MEANEPSIGHAPPRCVDFSSDIRIGNRVCCVLLAAATHARLPAFDDQPGSAVVAIAEGALILQDFITP